jgi:hypothetical protein
MRLAYYVVESQRLSRNSALVRILLVSADTLLEFAGENGSLFISNPQTRSLVESLIDEFAGKHDFDDEGAEEIFKTLLGATIVAFAENPPLELANKPGLKAVFAALSDARKSLGNKARIEKLTQPKDPAVDEGAIYLATTASVFYVWVYQRCSTVEMPGPPCMPPDTQRMWFSKGKDLIGKFLTEIEKTAKPGDFAKDVAPGRVRYLRWYAFLSNPK